MKKLNSIKKEQMFKNNTSMQKIEEVFYRDPYREFSLTEVSKLANVTKSMASIIVKELSKNNFIILNKINEKTWKIKANIEDFVFRKRKISYNIATIYSTNLIEHINSRFNDPKAIILFGSFRWGEDGQGSDIDIAVETSKNRELEIIEIPEAKNLEKALGRKIKIHIFNMKNIEKNLLVNIMNGIVLYGFLDYG